MFKLQKKFFLIITVILSLVLLAGCGTEKPVSETGAVTLKYAKGFKIENLADGCKKVTDGEGRVLLLVPQGKQPPTDYKNLPLIYTPVKRVVIVSTTQAAFLRPLDELGSIIGVNSEKNLWYIDEVKAGMENGKIQMVGSGGMGPLDYDRLVALK
nr:ABC transporter substrate-binding protein [Desulfitobacterium hafniense]